MDPYEEQPRRATAGVSRHPTPTPIYDRLLAEWREKGREPGRETPAVAAQEHTRAFVPAARRT
ncbi:hypothetical protein [Streptomyces nitrosporeus]|uniref:hypothetical protein n=1 Tax=Streptomyces nitrosporeus TaxID=28894 RepID=UPI0039A1E032